MIFPCFNRNAKKIEINGIDILADIVSPELHAWKQEHQRWRTRLTRERAGLPPVTALSTYTGIFRNALFFPASALTEYVYVWYGWKCEEWIKLERRGSAALRSPVSAHAKSNSQQEPKQLTTDSHYYFWSRFFTKKLRTADYEVRGTYRTFFQYVY